MSSWIFLTRALCAGVWLPLSAAHALAATQHAHVHGVAGLQVAVDAERLTLTFSSPLDNLVGFERAPRNAREKAAFDDMMTRLQRPEALFVPSPDARCVRTSVRIDSPVSAAQPSAAKQKADKATGKGEHDEHAALTAEVVFTCERRQNLSGLSIALFDVFPKLKRIDAQVAAPAKQIAAKLTSRNRQLTW